jgi:hypothetical protein
MYLCHDDLAKNNTTCGEGKHFCQSTAYHGSQKFPTGRTNNQSIKEKMRNLYPNEIEDNATPATTE